jgi:hypothetical protein
VLPGQGKTILDATVGFLGELAPPKAREQADSSRMTMKRKALAVCVRHLGLWMREALDIYAEDNPAEVERKAWSAADWSFHQIRLIVPLIKVLRRDEKEVLLSIQPS